MCIKASLTNTFFLIFPIEHGIYQTLQVKFVTLQLQKKQEE